MEQAFRPLKSIDLKIRPIYHHLEKRFRAHIFLCMLAYYVQWHMKEAWREVLFGDEEQEQKKDRDPVAAAHRSAKVFKKVRSNRLEGGSEAHSFRALLAGLSTIVCNTCRHRTAGREEARFTMMTRPNAEQKRALDLIGTISV